MNLKSIIETILFVRTEPTDLKTLAKISIHTEKEVLDALQELMREYGERGITLLENSNSWQFATHPANSSYVDEITKSEYAQELSHASLETLTIIAYKGPISRMGIEYLRGVNSSFTIRNLLVRGLIEHIENPKDTRSYMYRITFDFLKHVGLTHREQLPHFKEFNKQTIEVLDKESYMPSDEIS